MFAAMARRPIVLVVTLLLALIAGAVATSVLNRPEPAPAYVDQTVETGGGGRFMYN
jgi:hypothetical protein